MDADPLLDPPLLSDLPLWRLLVALDDAERTTGPHSGTTRALARAVQERLRRDRAPVPGESSGKEVARA
jgi:hypothetical protein